MTAEVTHPLIDAYVRDLGMLLHGIDPVERAEVLAGVNEHLDATLSPGSSDEDVRAVLAELGSPQSVADEAYAGRPAPAPIAPERPRPSPLPAYVACCINGVGLALLALVVALGVLRPGPMAPHTSEWAFVGTVFVIPWVLLIVLTAVTNVWGSADKFRSILFYPTSFALLVAIVLANIPVVSSLAAILLIAGGVWVLTGLVRSARR